MFLFALTPALAGAKLTTCDNPADSALDQYCGTVPTSTGSQVPQAGTPALATTLPPALARPVIATPGARPLLRLPAATRTPARSSRHHHATATPVSGSVNATESKVSAIPGWLIALVVVAALAMLAAAAARRRPRRGD